MLSDRPSPLDDYPRQQTSALTWLLSAIIAGFVLQLTLGSAWLNGGAALLARLELTIPAIASGQIWSLVTHSFLHSTGNLLHLAGNVFAIYFLGRELLPLLGTRRFLGLYGGGIVLGGLVWLAVHWRLGGALHGATAGVDALLVLFACFFPNRELRFLLFFAFPVTVRPKYVALAIAAFDVLGMMIYEVPGASLPFNLALANSAHLGGMAAGWLYFRFVHETELSFSATRRANAWPRWMKRANEEPIAPIIPETPAPKPENLRIELDRILDKINSEGFGALTSDEKRSLDAAKDLLSRQ